MRDIASPIDLELAARRARQITEPEGEAQRIGLSYQLQRLCDISHGCSRHAGWWDGPRNFGELMALIHSEGSEALEAGRKDRMDDHLPQYSGVGAELADMIIRIPDLAGALSIPLGEIVIAKMEYNAKRLDHKREHRAKEGGKQF